jgi:acyl-coenzyme A synthetase/AMP-(fatty) acid ligase
MTAYSSTNSLNAAVQDLLQGPKLPDKEFVRGGATFGEVYKMAAGLRIVLSDREQPGGMVCLAAEDKAMVAAALLASLGGGPTLLLPYAFSANTLAQLQQATGFTTALTDTTREFPLGVQVLYRQSTGLTGMPIAPQTEPRRELLKIFTGGSTGTPQVWSKTGENLFGEGFFLAKRFAVTEDDCILATIPPCHIYGLLFSVILPLVSSATVAPQTPSFPNEIVAAAKKQKATILASIPAHYRVLRDKKMSLRLAFSSAGMLDTEDNQMFSRQNSNGIVEVYGSTETGGIATRNRSLGEEFFTPFSTIRWKVIDSCLAVHSPFVSPELPVDGAGFFSTSDRVEAKGTAHFTLQGRTDSVTKVGGKRVDLEEISVLIKKEPGVRDCAVMALPEAGGREHRIGALIEGDTADTTTILKNLTLCLEPYALPRRLKKVERMPLTKNGKYDWIAIVQILTQ